MPTISDFRQVAAPATARRSVLGPLAGRLTAAAAVVAVGAFVASTTAYADSLSPAGSSRSVVDAGDAAYWTAQRMHAALPEQPRIATSAVPAPNSGVVTVAGDPQGRYSAGLAQVGTFFVATPTGNTTCTGSVIHSPGKDLVLSAGHCLHHWTASSHRIFVPAYRSGLDAVHQPYGFFPVTAVFTDPRFSAQATASQLTDLDFGFAVTGRNNAGDLLEDATGALTLRDTPSYHNRVTVPGYPGASHNPARRVWTCSVTTAPLPGYHQMQMACPGFYGGTSGGPWIANYDPTTHTGDVIGETGGLYGGGDTDGVSYSPMFDEQIQALYADAVSGTVSARSPYQTPGAPGALPGAPTDWKNARLLASGDYTGDHRSDLLTVWADGKISLFSAASTGGYAPATVLRAPNRRWRTARLIAGGDFDGRNLSDLMVVWNDGTLSVFVDTGTAGLGREMTYAVSKADNLKDARQIAAGNFAKSGYATDLVVLRSSGELVLYSHTGGGSLGAKRRLGGPSTAWRHATIVSGGPDERHSAWDLMVRRSDGELDSFPAVSPRGLGAEHRLLKPNTRWRSAAVITAGNVTADAHADDVLVRWTDGRVTRYPHTTPEQLGPEQPLNITGS